MKATGRHYSLAHKPMVLSAWAIEVAEAISENPEWLDGRIPILCYTGMSGTAHATALSLALHSRNIHHWMVYVRKSNEESHGFPLETSIPREFLRDSGTFRSEILNKSMFLFVDDMICGGGTIRRTLETIVHNIHGLNNKIMEPEFVMIATMYIIGKLPYHSIQFANDYMVYNFYHQLNSHNLDTSEEDEEYLFQFRQSGRTKRY